MKPKKKRRRIVSHSDESEQENSDGNKMDVDEVATPKSKVFVTCTKTSTILINLVLDGLSSFQV